MTPPRIRSPKVTKILALEARARRLLTRWDRALDRAVRARAEAQHALDRAQGIEWTLAGGQLGELRRGRARQGPRPARSATATAPPSSSPTTSL